MRIACYDFIPDLSPFRVEPKINIEVSWVVLCWNIRKKHLKLLNLLIQLVLKQKNSEKLENRKIAAAPYIPICQSHTFKEAALQNYEQLIGIRRSKDCIFLLYVLIFTNKIRDFNSFFY